MVPVAPAAERALESYPAKLKTELGGYYTLGRAFVKLIGHPAVMRVHDVRAAPPSADAVHPEVAGESDRCPGWGRHG